MTGARTATIDACIGGACRTLRSRSNEREENQGVANIANNANNPLFSDG
jgi:hypothetical protein